MFASLNTYSKFIKVLQEEKTYTGIVIAKRYRDYFGKQIENKEKFVYIKGVIRSRKSKQDRQYSDRKKNNKKTNDDLHITQKIKD